LNALAVVSPEHEHLLNDSVAALAIGERGLEALLQFVEVLKGASLWWKQSKL